MYMLRQRITSKTSLASTPTWRYKLPNHGKYTAIELVVDCNRYADRADADAVYPIETQVSKIELVEGGSKALLSLSASQLDALNYWQFGRPNARRYKASENGDNMLHLYILGGRSLYDTEYGFDFAKLAETYLEYTHSLSADVAELFDVSTHTVYLYGWRWMGPGEPDFKGYFRARQLATWTTTAADALKTVEIPTGNPYRLIGVQAKTVSTSVGGTVSKVELKVNNGEYSPVTIVSPMQYCMQEVAEYNLFNRVSGIDKCVGTDDTYLPPWWGYMDDIKAGLYGTIGAYTLNLHSWALPPRIRATGAGNPEVVFSLSGYAFQKCMRLGFDHLPDMSDLLHTRGMGALDLELTENAAAKAAAVFTQDVITY